MPGEGETAVETSTPAVEVVEKKEELVEGGTNEEKKDLEKSEKESESKSSPSKKGVKKASPAAPPPPQVHKKDFEKDVVYLFQFNRCHNLPSISPYCLKTETWLKYNNVKYEVREKYLQMYI